MKNKKGFTLLELLVVMAIIGIMAAVAIVSLNGSKNTKAVEAAGRQLAAAIRETQTYALTGKNTSSNCNDPKRAIYTFSFGAPDSSSYQIYNGPSYGASGCTSEQVALTGGAVFATPQGSITFSVPFGAVISGTNEIILTKGSSNYAVCICASGKVVEQAGGQGICANPTNLCL